MNSRILAIISIFCVSAAAGCFGSEVAPTDKPSPSPIRPIVDEEAIVPTFGPGMEILAGSSPMSIAQIRNVIYVVGLGKLAALRSRPLAAFAQIATPGPALDLAALGEELFVADGRAGLTVYSILASGEPTFVRNYPSFGECKRVVASEKAVAVLCSARKLIIVRPGNESVTISLPGEAVDAVWLGESLYLTSPGNGVMKWDFATKAEPHIFYENKLDRALSLTAMGSRLFIGLRDKSVVEIDPTDGRRLAEITVLNRPLRLAAGNGRLLVGSTWLGDPGATVVDVSNPKQLLIKNRWSFSIATGAFLDAETWLVTRPEGDLALVQSNGQELQKLPGVRFDRVAGKLEFGSSWAEERAAQWNWKGENADIAFSSRKIADATACGEALCVLESSGRLCRQRMNDLEVDCLDIPREAGALAWQPSNALLWVMDAHGELHRVEAGKRLEHKASLPPVKTTCLQNYARLAIAGNRAVAIDVDYANLQIVDLGQTPRFRGRFLLHSLPRAVALVEDVAFVAEPAAGVQIIDISRPDAPRELAWHPMQASPKGIATHSDEKGRVFVIIAEGERGVSVWQWLPNARKLQKIRHADTPGLATDLVFSGHELLVADGSSIRRFSAAELFP